MTKLFLLALILTVTVSVDDNPEVGYRVGTVRSYKQLRSFKGSKLFEVECDKLDDGRPIKLLELHGTHFQAGYAYGKLMAKEIAFTYKTFFKSMLDTELQIKLVQLFLDWQYDYVRKQIPIEFLDEIKGIRKAGREEGYKLMGMYFERVLVISSFPGSLQNDILSILADEFLRQFVGNDQAIEKFIQLNYLKAAEIIKKFIKKAGIHCSFFSVWGTRTENGKLFSMRNLDWAENTGVNVNKLITVWRVKDTIPHLTLGFPGILGALTGMSRQGITVHEAGLSSHLSTQVGFQWTLRMRYVMMNAHNLDEAIKIWKSTNNTLGMNYMIASANDLKSGKPAVALETMRNYTAFFFDNDKRENGTMFKDPRTNKTYQAGFSMPEALFRTNHAYDPTINKFRRDPLIAENDDSMIRYKILKDGFNWYKNEGIEMGEEQSLNLTAILGDKGSEYFMSCKKKADGVNVISVAFEPESLKMWAGFEYSSGKTFRSACCGVYVEMDMAPWLNGMNNLISE